MAEQTQPNVASPLLEKEKDVELPEYNDIEKEYFKKVTEKTLRAREDRDQKHDEFDGMTYLEACEYNRKGANTFIEPKKTKTDTNYASGTIRQKLFTYLAAMMSLDLGVDVEAYDEKSREKKELAEAMEDIIFAVGEQDGEGGDEEKKMLRFYTMFEQGTVFVRETYAKRYKVKKILDGKFNGKLDSVKWSKRMEEVNEGCTRHILLNENVILGNIRQYDMKKQPFVVDIDILPRDDAKSIYGKWERWPNVPKVCTDILNSGREASKTYNPFKLYTAQNKEDVEVIRFQSIYDNEFMIFLNGVMMLKVGFPMLQDDYDIAKQVNEVISSHFAYGKSWVTKLRNNSILMDEMIRLAIKKTQKSLAPPLLNTSGKTLTQRVFAPGTITGGIKEGSISKLDPNATSVDMGELNMIQFLQNKIDEKSTNPVFSGQQPQGTPTATQILEVQRQAKMVISLTVLTCSLLEYKLGWLRLQSILRNWFKPKGRKYNQYTDEFITKYQSIVREKNIEGAGMGQHIIKVAEKIPTVEEQIEEENALSTATRPVRITYMDPEYVTSSKLMWFINIVPKEKKSDALNKVLFNEFVQGAMGFPDANIRHLEERYAEVWGENPAKLFPQSQQPPPETAGVPPVTGTQASTPAQGPSKPSALAGVPQTPTPERSKSALLQLAGKAI